MTNGEAVNWLINISADIGKAEHRDLWHYEQALYEIREMLESAQPEQRVEELLPDGTLHLFTDTDLSKVNRVWVSQNNTHYGDLYYADEDPNRGKWIVVHPTKESTEYVACDQCGQVEAWDENVGMLCALVGERYAHFCPNCGARMSGGESCN